MPQDLIGGVRLCRHLRCHSLFASAFASALTAAVTVLQSNVEPIRPNVHAVVTALVQIVLAEALIEASYLSNTLQNTTLQKATSQNTTAGSAGNSLEDTGALAHLSMVLTSSQLVINASVGVLVFIIILVLVYGWFAYTFLAERDQLNPQKQKKFESKSNVWTQSEQSKKQETDNYVTKRRKELHEVAQKERNSAVDAWRKSKTEYAEAGHAAREGIQHAREKTRELTRSRSRARSPDRLTRSSTNEATPHGDEAMRLSAASPPGVVDSATDDEEAQEPTATQAATSPSLLTEWGLVPNTPQPLPESVTPGGNVALAATPSGSKSAETSEDTSPKVDEQTGSKVPGAWRMREGVCLGFLYCMAAAHKALVAAYDDFKGNRIVGTINTWLCCSTMCCVAQAETDEFDQWLDVRFCYHLHWQLSQDSCSMTVLRFFLRLYVLAGIIFGFALSRHPQELIIGTFVSLIIVIVNLWEILKAQREPISFKLVRTAHALLRKYREVDDNSQSQNSRCSFRCSCVMPRKPQQNASEAARDAIMKGGAQKYQSQLRDCVAPASLTMAASDVVLWHSEFALAVLTNLKHEENKVYKALDENKAEPLLLMDEALRA